MIPEHMAENSHRIMRPEVSRLSGTVQGVWHPEHGSLY